MSDRKKEFEMESILSFFIDREQTDIDKTPRWGNDFLKV